MQLEHRVHAYCGTIKTEINKQNKTKLNKIYEIIK